MKFCLFYSATKRARKLIFYLITIAISSSKSVLYVHVHVCVYVLAGQGHIVTQRNLELHNEGGGAWSIVDGKVYDFKELAAKVHVRTCTCIQNCMHN